MADRDHLKNKEKDSLTGEDFFIYGSDLSEFLNWKNWKPYIIGVAIIVCVLIVAIIAAV